MCLPVNGDRPQRILDHAGVGRHVRCFGRIDRSHLGSIDFGVIGPTDPAFRANRLTGGA
jgi:hypothetical protein